MLSASIIQRLCHVAGEDLVMLVRNILELVFFTPGSLYETDYCQLSFWWKISIYPELIHRPLFPQDCPQSSVHTVRTRRSAGPCFEPPVSMYPRVDSWLFCYAVRHRLSSRLVA